MQRHSMFGIVLAASMSLSALVGCATPAQVSKIASESGVAVTKPTTTSLAAPVAAPATAKAEQDVSALSTEEVQDTTAQVSADAAADEATIQDYSLMLEGAVPKAYVVLQAQAAAKASGEIDIAPKAPAPKPMPSGAPKPGQMPPMMGPKPGMMPGMAAIKPAFKEKLDEQVRAQVEKHQQEMKAKLQERLDKRKDETARVQEAAKGSKWVDNGDGTKTMTMETDVEKDGIKRHVKAEHTIKTQGGLLVHLKMELTEQLPDGKTKTIVHEKTLQADGSYQMSFQSETSGKDGAKQQAGWTKTVTPDGKVQGEGKLIIADKQGKSKEVKLAVEGSDDTPSFKAKHDDGSTVEVKMAASGAPEAKVMDAKGAATSFTFDPKGRFQGRIVPPGARPMPGEMPGMPGGKPGMMPGKPGEVGIMPVRPGKPGMMPGKPGEVGIMPVQPGPAKPVPVPGAPDATIMPVAPATATSKV